MGDPAANHKILEGFWDAMYRQDWDAFSAHFAEDATYTDACTPADEFAEGPQECTARLRLGIDPLEYFGDERTEMAASGDIVATEHIEVWRWPTGEEMRLPVASFHVLRDGKILRWTDYWDMQTLVNAAPTWWFEQMMKGYK